MWEVRIVIYLLFILVRKYINYRFLGEHQAVQHVHHLPSQSCFLVSRTSSLHPSKLYKFNNHNPTIVVLCLIYIYTLIKVYDYNMESITGGTVAFYNIHISMF